MENKTERITYVFTEDFTKVLYADIMIIIVLFLLTLFWKEQRITMMVGLGLYSFFTVMWPFPPGLLTY